MIILRTERPLAAFGRAAQSLWNWITRGWNRITHGHRPPVTGLDKRLLTQRDTIRAVLDRKWQQAVLLTAGRLGFDYGCLLAALRATGADPRPSLVLLAYSGANIVALLPLTPGGLGLVEASLSGLLILAGVRPGYAFLATLAYRVASYWLPLLAGPPAYLLYRHRYGRPGRPARRAGWGGLQHIARVYATRARAAFPARGLVGWTGQMLDDTGSGPSLRRRGSGNMLTHTVMAVLGAALAAGLLLAFDNPGSGGSGISLPGSGAVPAPAAGCPAGQRRAGHRHQGQAGPGDHQHGPAVQQRGGRRDRHGDQRRRAGADQQPRHRRLHQDHRYRGLDGQDLPGHGRRLRQDRGHRPDPAAERVRADHGADRQLLFGQGRKRGRGPGQRRGPGQHHRDGRPGHRAGPDHHRQRGGRLDRLRDTERDDPDERRHRARRLRRPAGELGRRHRHGHRGQRRRATSSRTAAGFAIPINTALSVARQIAGGHASPTITIGYPPFMGIFIGSGSSSSPQAQAQQQEQQQNGASGGSGSSPACYTSNADLTVPSAIAPVSSGTLIDGTICGSPAASACMTGGAVITAVNGQAVGSPGDLTGILARFDPGEVISVTWVSPSGQRSTSSLHLTAGPPQ